MDKKYIELLEGEASCVVVQNEIILHQTAGIGVKPLLGIYNGSPQDFMGSQVYDTVIGKAAAVILILGGVSSVYGKVMSEPGRNLLANHGITAEYGTLVPMIRNRTDTDFCPLEKAVARVDNLATAFEAINETIRELMRT